MAAKVMEIKDKLEVVFRNKSKPWTPILDKLEGLTVFVALTALWLIFGFAGQLVCNFIGFIYPAYISISAIESSRKDDDTKWLTYWVVFALFSLIEFFADIIVGWFPLYWLMKCIFMVWLMLPIDSNGSTVIYNRIIKPYYLQHHSKIENTILRAQHEASKLLDKHE